VSSPGVRPTQPLNQWVLGVCSPGVKRNWSMTLATHPHPVPRSRMWKMYPLPLVACMDVAEHLYFSLLIRAIVTSISLRVIQLNTNVFTKKILLIKAVLSINYLKCSKAEYVRLHVITVAIKSIPAFWDNASCSFS
jgi:hypothetical protein